MNRPQRPRTGWLIALIVVLILHLIALYTPGSPQPGELDYLQLDKIVHFALFGVPTYLAIRMGGPKWVVWLIIIHAPISELVQWQFIPFRSGDPFDLLADLLGVATAWLLGTRAESKHGRSA